jgi:hypothetical protein
MENYRIIDITVTPYIVVPGKESLTLEECILWINENGGDCPLCNYTIQPSEHNI